MKKYFRLMALLLMMCMVVSGCGKEEELGAWEMPVVDSKPTVEPTAMPSFGGGSPESYVWNELEYFSMEEPGAPEGSQQETYSHKQCAALFPYNFLPTSIFSESYSNYDKLSLKKTEHEVMLSPEDMSLAENSYVEYVYAPKGGKETECLYVMAELCSFGQAADIYERSSYPHVIYPEQARPTLSRYYLKDFVLAKYGQQRVAQILKLYPNSYFADSRAAMDNAAAEGQSFTPQRQILLTVSCGVDMSDEEFIAAVCTLLQYSDGSEKPVESSMPKPGEKGYA